MPSAAPLFLGLDIGTSGVKALLVDETGTCVASAQVPLTLATPQPGWAEQHPDDWWRATIDVIAAVRAARPDANIAAVGLSGQMHSSVFLDADAQVVRPALLWCDGRTTAECAEIVERVGGESQLRDWVCNPALEGFTLPKLLWLRAREPEAFGRVRTLMLAKDFIRLRLTGRVSTEPSDASGTLMFDSVRGVWQPELLRAVGVSTSLLPPVDASHAVHGTVTEGAARITGLRAGTPSWAAVPTMPVAPRGWAWCRPEVVWPAGAPPARCSPRCRARWWIRRCARTRSRMSRPRRGM